MEEYRLCLREITKKDNFHKAYEAQETGYSGTHNKFLDWTVAEYDVICTDKS